MYTWAWARVWGPSPEPNFHDETHETGPPLTLTLQTSEILNPVGILFIFAKFLHFRQHKTYQGTLGTQRWTLIGSRTSHGPSMDPTGPIKWASKLSSCFQAWFAIPTLYTHCNHSNHVGTLFWSLWISTKAQWTLLDLHGPLNGPQNGPCEANFRGPLY